MLFAEVVAACRDVADATKRDDKVAVLVDLFNGTPPSDLEPVVAFTTGVSRHEWVDLDDGATDLAEVKVPVAAEASTLTVRGVDRTFGRLESLAGTGSDDDRRQLLVELYRRATQDEQAFIASVVSGHNRLAAPDSIVTTAVARTAGTRVREVQRAATVAGSLHAAARIALRDGSEGLRDVGIEIGWPVDLMRVSVADDVEDALDSVAAATVERRLNGVRIQAHRSEGEVQLFQRDLDEVTDRFPTVANTIRSFPGGDFVLDGEIVALDAAGRPVDGVGALGEDIYESGVEIRPFFFDVLSLDRTVIDEPLATRRELLSTVVPAISRVPAIDTTEPAEVRRFLAEARRWGYEGIVVKDLGSAYEPGRRTRAWRQIKPVHTLDLVVLGAEWGTGRRRRYLSTLHLGARSEDGGFVMVGKATKGLTDQMLRWQTARFRDLQLDSDDDDDDDVVKVRPEQVVEVAVDGADPSDRYPGGVSLRFASVREFRRDARPDDADSIESVRALMSLVGNDPMISRFGDRSAAIHVEADAAALIGLPPRDPPPERRVDPDRPPYESEIPRSLQDIGVAGRRVIDDIDFDFPSYEEPELLPMSHASLAVLVTRAIALTWVLAVTIAAFVVRARSGETGRTVDTIGWAGVGVVLMLAVAGWWWSDRRTRNLHRLDGRWPSRVRCATAWASPLVMALILWGTLIQLDPSELFDVRPPIISALFAAAMWRPYSLVRRIFATLIRVRFDPLVGAGFVLDIVAFGLIWWRLADWPPRDQRPGSGEIDTMIGVALAASLAMLLGLLVWVLLLRTGVYAEAHRASSQRTRYEHRMLRLRNVDPTDPEVWWALVQRRADEQREAERIERAEREALDVERVGVAGADITEIPTGDMFVEAVQRNHRVALQRLGKTESAVLLDRLREKYADAIAEAGIDVSHPLDDVLDDVGVKSVARGGGVPDVDVDPVASDRDLLDDVGVTSVARGDGVPDVEVEKESSAADVPDVEVEPVANDRGVLDDVGVKSVVSEADVPDVDVKPLASDRDVLDDDSESVASDDGVPDVDLEPVARGRDVLDDLGARFAANESGVSGDGDASSATSDRNVLDDVGMKLAAGLGDTPRGVPSEQTADAVASADETLLKRLRTAMERAALLGEPDPMLDGAVDSSQASLRNRLGVQNGEELARPSPLEQLLEQAGQIHIEAALAERRREADANDLPRMVPPKLYILEATRGLVLIALAATVATAVWLVSRTVSASADVDVLTRADVTDIERARRSVFDAFSIVVVAAPLWAYSIAVFARRCESPFSPTRRTFGAFLGSAAFTLLAFVADADVRGNVTLLLLFPAAILAAFAVLSLAPTARWFDLRTTTLLVWSAFIPLVLIIVALGQLQQPIEANASLPSLTFFTIVVAIVNALAVTVAASSTVDFEDVIRLSPVLAVPARATRRKRRSERRSREPVG